MKKTATAEQIAGWTQALLNEARASLPHDHPLCSVGPGRYPYETHAKAAREARKQMAKYGVVAPSEDELRDLANGGVDIATVRASEATLREVYAMRRTLDQAHVLDLPDLAALADALRPIVDRMRAALPQETEKSK